jgi:hypothetical protein
VVCVNQYPILLCRCIGAKTDAVIVRLTAAQPWWPSRRYGSLGYWLARNPGILGDLMEV